MEAYYAEKLPGVKFQARRALIISHLKVVCFSIGRDILEDNEYAQAAYGLVCAQWRTTVQMQAKNPFELPEQQGWSISGHDAQHLTRITKHCVVSFICRDCGYYGPCWAQAVTGNWWFRCYRCGAQYMRWKTGAGKSECNRVIAIQDPISQVVRHIPAFWPATADDHWLTRTAVTFARQIERPADLESLASKTAVDLSKLVSQAGKSSHYIKFDFKEPATFRFSAPRWPLDKFEHIVQGDFVGQILRPPTARTSRCSMTGRRWPAPWAT